MKERTMDGGFRFVKCNRLEATNKNAKKASKAEKIFGSADLENDKENIIEMSSVLHKENIARCER